MISIPIIMPQLGESIAEATVIAYLIQPGSPVEADQDVLTVETNKATMNVTAPCRGVLSQWVAKLDQSYAVGTILGSLQATEDDAIRVGLITGFSREIQMPGDNTNKVMQKSSSDGDKVVEPTIRGLPVPAHAAGASYMSPRMKARMHELGLHAADLAGLPGSGAGGRVTVEDFERFLQVLENLRITPASSMRVAVADAMRRSWTRPLATVGMPVPIDALLAHRKTTDPKPGPTLYAMRALGLALAENSAPAGRLVGQRIVHPASIDIGFAVEAEDGVLVPVLKQVDKRPLLELSAAYNRLVELARQRQLPAESLGPGVATVTNFGTFGLTWATPIPLPEQTLVLGMGAGRKAPLWSEKEQRFVPVMECNLTLSFDHRVLDGGAAGRLLTRVAELISNPAAL